MALVFIDLDGTLIEGTGSERLFFRFLLKKRLLGPLQAVSFLSFAVRYLPRFGSDVWKKNKAYLAGLQERDVHEAARVFAGERLSKSIRREMKERIARHRHEGDETILLTGSLLALAQPLARHAGIDRVAATICAVANGRFEALPPLVHPFQDEKRHIAESLCREKGVALRECAAYGDSIHDLPLLEAAGTAVAVHPDRRLEKIARRRLWEIL